MANFSHRNTNNPFTEPFKKEDNFMTPKYAWENITEHIPKDKVVWEPFYGDGTSGEYLKELGCKDVIHNNEDFFSNDHGEIIISNPPYSESKNVLTRMKELDKPFILILPCSKITTAYFKKLFKDNIQIIIPEKRIHFTKYVDGERMDDFECSFDCFYYCYKMNFTKDIIWL